MDHIRRAATLAAAIAALSSAAASAQRYYARTQVEARRSPATATPAPATPSSKADCTGPVYDKTVMVTRFPPAGSSTTPYLPDNAWRGPATAVCNGFDYGGSGSCIAFHLKNEGVVRIEGYNAAYVSGTAAMSSSADSAMVLSCVNR